MTPLDSVIDISAESYLTNRDSMLRRLIELDAVLDLVRAGGGERYVERHRRRGKLLVRERIELLVDRDAPFLELSPFVGWNTPHQVGGSVVSGIGVIESIECMLIGHDPTVRGGAMNPFSWKKIARALQIATQNRLPTIVLVESGGADLPNQLELFIPGGRLFRDITRLSAEGVPTVALVFGSSTAGGAYLPAMCDYTVLVRERAKVFLGGPPLVKVATGEDSSDEELGGAEMHSVVSGLSDYMADDEQDAIRIGRDIVRRLNWRKPESNRSVPAPPIHDPEELLGVMPADPKIPLDPREILARIVDASVYDEFKPLYGSALTTGWASIHGFPLGILANVRGVLFSEEAQKAAQFIQLANQKAVPLLFVHNTTGFMVGKQYEQGGIVKDGGKMINAVSNSAVPHLGLIVGGSYGAANYAMSGRAYEPRLLFAWPSALSAVMGPEQLAGVMSIVARQSAKAAGRTFDESANAKLEESIRSQIEREQIALAVSAQGYDDGIIDPRDSRTVLGIALSICHGRPIHGTPGYGVFRM